MKTIVRALALALVATGAIASTHIASASQPTISSKVSAMPIASCPPSDPNGCGICNARACTSGN